MLVQVVKEERGNKGAALTTYLSLAGRYCVLMPNTARGGGISRKITNAVDRKRLREIAGEMDVPRGMGLIVRTAGAERTRAEIKRDYEFLLRQWEQIRDLTLKSIAPTLIYEEGSLIKRSIRDLYSKEIDQVLVEGEAGYREAKEYMKMLMPSHAKNVQPYADPVSLFGRYQVESYLNGMFNPTVQLRSGGYIVIGVTEALVAIDVNSGRATKQGSVEETALQTNLEAADEVSRQLRLRDLAGLIVIDFIDMDENRNNRAVEKRMKDRLKTDRARIQMGRISAFGLMEMSRQRLRPGMIEATTKPCPHCHGMGLIRSDDSLALAILREVEEEGLRGRADEITVRAPVEIANYLINAKRGHVAQVEARNSIAVLVIADPALVSPNYDVVRSKTQGRRPAPAARDVVSSASVVTEDELSGETLADETAADDEVELRDRDQDDGNGGGDGEAGARRRRGRRGGRRRRGEGEEARRPQEARENQDEAERGDRAEQEAERGDRAEQEAERGDRPGAEDDDERPRSRRGRSRRRRGRRGDDQTGGQMGDQTGGQNGERNGGQAGDSEQRRAGADQQDAPAAAETVTDGTAIAGTVPDEAEPQAPRPPETREGADAPADIASHGQDTRPVEQATLMTEPSAAEPQEAASAAETGGTPLPSAEAPADVAGLDAGIARETDSASWPDSGDGGSVGRIPGAETGETPRPTEQPVEEPAPADADADADAEAAPVHPEPLEDNVEAPAEAADEERPPEPAKPKKRGWWSLGL